MTTVRRLPGLTAALAVLAAAVVLLQAPPVVRVPAGIALSGYLTGSALLGALRVTLRDPLLRHAAAIGCSLGLCVVAGVSLHLLGIEIEEVSWVVVLTTTVLVCIAAQAARGRERDEELGSTQGFSARQLCFGLSAVLAIAAIALAHRSEQHRQVQTDLAELAIVPSPQRAGSATVTVHNDSLRARRFSIRIAEEGSSRPTTQVIGLSPDGLWQRTVALGHRLGKGGFTAELRPLTGPDRTVQRVRF
jgi:hypothetical protein